MTDEKQTYDYAFCMGLQRTGTNWISTLIHENFETIVASNIFWKHLTPFGVKQPYHGFLHPLPPNSPPEKKFFMYDTITLPRNVFFLLTSKDFDLWVESIDRKAADVYMTHNGIHGRNDLDKLHKVWFQMKDEILTRFPDNAYYQRYEDWYTNWETYLAEIEQMTGWKRKHDTFVNPKEVHMSPDFNPDNYRHLEEK